MKTTKQNIANIILFLALLLVSQSASAFYDPSTGRWLSRDPIGEPGFQAIQNLAVLPQARNYPSQTSRWISRDPIGEVDSELELTGKPTSVRPSEVNLYGFILNDPQNRVDPLGLISFKNCDSSQQADIQNAWNSMCSMVNDPKYQCCVNRSSLFPLFKRRCSWGNVKFECKKGDVNSPCGHSLKSFGIGRGYVVLYGNAWDTSRCGQLKCTLVHEMTHILAGTPFEGGVVGSTDSCCEQH